MKEKLIKHSDIPFYMVAGLGLFSLLNLLFRWYSELPALIVMIGFSLGLLLYWEKTKVVKKIDFGGNIKAIKFYVYLFQLVVYVTAFFGLTELFSLYSGQSSIDVYESEIFSWKSYTFSWRWIFYPFIIIWGWHASAKGIIEDAMKNTNKQNA